MSLNTELGLGRRRGHPVPSSSPFKNIQDGTVSPGNILCGTSKHGIPFLALTPSKFLSQEALDGKILMYKCYSYSVLLFCFFFLLFYDNFDFSEMNSVFTKEAYLKALLPDLPDSRFRL